MRGADKSNRERKRERESVCVCVCVYVSLPSSRQTLSYLARVNALFRAILRARLTRAEWAMAEWTRRLTSRLIYFSQADIDRA